MVGLYRTGGEWWQAKQYILTYTHTYIHTYVHMYTHTYINIYSYLYTYRHTHTYYIHIYLYTNTHIHTYTHIYTYIQTHTYIHTHTHTHTHTETHTHCLSISLLLSQGHTVKSSGPRSALFNCTANSMLPFHIQPDKPAGFTPTSLQLIARTVLPSLYGMPDTIPVRPVRLDRQGCKINVHFVNVTTTGLSDLLLALVVLSV